MTNTKCETPVRPKTDVDVMMKVNECGVCGLDMKVSEEVVEAKIKRCKHYPSAKEREDHEVTHLPFREWCETCVAARAKAEAHTEREISEKCQDVHVDYCFLRNKKGEDYVSVVALKDKRSKLLASHVVPNKGASSEWVVQQCLRDLEKMGHANMVILRSDSEPALMDLFKCNSKQSEKESQFWNMHLRIRSLGDLLNGVFSHWKNL